MRRVGSALIGIVAVVLAAPRVGAQMLATPVLQNAFANPGFTIGADYGHGESANAYGVALAWAPRSTRFQLSAGAGAFDPSAGSATGTWGARAMVPAKMLLAGHLALAGFVGLGGAHSHGTDEIRVPVGISVGYRRALGATRGVSAYVAPFYSWARQSTDSAAVTNGEFRVSIGIDAAVLPQIGVTIGYETGTTAAAGRPGPSSGTVGVGVSYALHHP